MKDESPMSPGRAIQEALDRLRWTHDQLAAVMGKHRPEVTLLISGKRRITPEIAVALGEALGPSAEHWMNLEMAYQLAQVDCRGDVSKRAKLYEWAPIKDMERRGWISPTNDEQSLDRELMRFFGTDSLDRIPCLFAATRRSGKGRAEPDLTPKQRAWCFRVRQLGAIPAASRFRLDDIPKMKKRLRELAAYPSETKLVPETLGEFGIRFVVVQPIPGTHVEGVTLWLDDEKPVIGMSLLQNRLDSFWHTLMHEVSHVVHRDDSVDIALTGEGAEPFIVKDPIEQRADEEACHDLIPRDELQSFIGRVGPLYYRDKIVGFAHRIKIHPAMIVGRLQHLGEIGWHAHKDLTPNVRDLVTPTALTDGYGSDLSI